MSKPYKSIQIFKNPSLERLTHVHPLTPLVLWAPIVAWLLFRSYNMHGLSSYTIGTMLAIGLFCWTFVEYILHRFIFHFNPTNKFQERIEFLIHGLHHADPVDPTRLVMPPFGSIFLAIILFTIFRTILGRHLVEPYFAGFVIGYLCYDYIHYAVHHFNPRTKLGKFLKQSHMQHHFVSPHARWGVSSPIWDYVFGTLEEHKPVRHGS